MTVEPAREIRFRPAAGRPARLPRDLARRHRCLPPAAGPDGDPARQRLRRLHRHALATDPARFMVADRRGPGGRDGRGLRVGDARRPLWFLSMLFVGPGAAGAGSAARCSSRSCPRPPTRALAVHRQRPADLERAVRLVRASCPGCRCSTSSAGRRPEAAGRAAGRDPGDRSSRPSRPPTGAGPSRELAAFDRALLGFSHPQDHRFVQGEPRHVRLSRRRRGPPRLRLRRRDRPPRPDRGPRPGARGAGAGPPAHRRRAARRVGGLAAGRGRAALAMRVRAGFRIEGFPVLAGWSRPFTDFSRYVPTSPGCSGSRVADRTSRCVPAGTGGSLPAT